MRVSGGADECGVSLCTGHRATERLPHHRSSAKVHVETHPPPIALIIILLFILLLLTLLYN